MRTAWSSVVLATFAVAVTALPDLPPTQLTSYDFDWKPHIPMGCPDGQAMPFGDESQHATIHNVAAYTFNDTALVNHPIVNLTNNAHEYNVNGIEFVVATTGGCNITGISAAFMDPGNSPMFTVDLSEATRYHEDGDCAYSAYYDSPHSYMIPFTPTLLTTSLASHLVVLVNATEPNESCTLGISLRLRDVADYTDRPIFLWNTESNSQLYNDTRLVDVTLPYSGLSNFARVHVQPDDQAPAMDLAAELNKFNLRAFNYRIDSNNEECLADASVVVYYGNTTVTEWGLALDGASQPYTINGTFAPIQAVDFPNGVDLSEDTFQVFIENPSNISCTFYMHFVAEVDNVRLETLTDIVHFPSGLGFQATCDNATTVDDLASTGAYIVKIEGSETTAYDTVLDLVNIENGAKIQSFAYFVYSMYANGTLGQEQFTLLTGDGDENVTAEVDVVNSNGVCYYTGLAATPQVSTLVSFSEPWDTSVKPFVIQVDVGGLNGVSNELTYVGVFYFDLVSPVESATFVDLEESNPETGYVECDAVWRDRFDYVKNTTNLVRHVGDNNGPNPLFKFDHIDGEGNTTVYSAWYTIVAEGACVPYTVHISYDDGNGDVVVSETEDLADDPYCYTMYAMDNFHVPMTFTNTSGGPSLTVSVTPFGDDTGCTYYTHFLYDTEFWVDEFTNVMYQTTPLTEFSSYEEPIECGQPPQWSIWGDKPDDVSIVRIRGNETNEVDNTLTMIEIDSSEETIRSIHFIIEAAERYIERPCREPFEVLVFAGDEEIGGYEFTYEQTEASKMCADTHNQPFEFDPPLDLSVTGPLVISVHPTVYGENNTCNYFAAIQVEYTDSETSAEPSTSVTTPSASPTSTQGSQQAGSLGSFRTYLDTGIAGLFAAIVALF